MSQLDPWQGADGVTMVPIHIESEDGDTEGFTWVPLTPEHPQYHEWIQFIRSSAPAEWASAVSDRLPS